MGFTILKEVIKMKKYLLTILALATITLIGVLNLSKVNADVTTNQDIKQLQMQHIILDIPKVNSKISKDEAILKAKEAFPQWANDATETMVEYHLVSNDDFQMFSDNAKEKNADIKSKNHLDKVPAYIVSFKGMSYQGHVPSGFKGVVPVHHEYNVIVDAMSGEPLYGFSYR
jgi:hypothetical protein